MEKQYCRQEEQVQVSGGNKVGMNLTAFPKSKNKGRALETVLEKTSKTVRSET